MGLPATWDMKALYKVANKKGEQTGLKRLENKG